MKNIVSILRTIAFSEAVSYLLLLGIAMPLKYVWQMPMAVKIVGSIHGVLFLAFCYALGHTLLLARWPLSRAASIFIASFIPILPFFLDGRMKNWAEDYAKRKHAL